MRLLFLFILLSASGAHAQSSPEDSVKARVMSLFDAMRKGDSTLITTQFAQGAQLQSVNTDGKVETLPIPRFAQIISALPAGAADERPRLEVVHVDGALAMVWASYQFFYKGTLHHCGVDSFQLVRQGGAWKIQYIIDTERKDGCQ